MQAAKELACDVGAQVACAALGVSRATYYRRQRVPPQTHTPPSRPAPRALSEPERQAVLALLHEPRFVDREAGDGD